MTSSMLWMLAFTPDRRMHFRGHLYRALNPIYALEPYSGRGAQIYGGRFNRRGVPALYTSLRPSTALLEANQVGHLQPTTVVSYNADLELVFDGRNAAALQTYGVRADELADPSWRDQMKMAGSSKTQEFADNLIRDGHHGLLVRSFARGATAEDLNLVVWTWSPDGPARLTLIDDENRLRLRL